MKIRFEIAAHENLAEEAEEWAEDDHEEHPEIPLDKLVEWYETDPLYEVVFTVEYDTETKEFEIVGFKI